MKSIIFTTVVVILLILIIPGVLAVGIINIPDRYQPSLDQVQKIYSSVVLSQSFLSKRENLSIIGVSIKNPNLENKKDIFLSVYDTSNNLLAKSVVSGKSIPDGEFIKFKFVPINNSKDKLFTF